MAIAPAQAPDFEAGSQSPFDIFLAEKPEDIEMVRALFIDCVKSFNVDISFQDFTSELANLPGKYAPPTGCLLLARSRASNAIIACVGLRPITSAIHPEGGCCEMKRLFVVPEGRGTGIAMEMVKASLEYAKNMGYKTMLLDTLQRMQPAVRLYMKAGFTQTGEYYKNPLEGVMYFEKEL